MNRVENPNTDRCPKTVEGIKVDIRKLCPELLSRNALFRRGEMSVTHAPVTRLLFYIPFHSLTVVNTAHVLVQRQEYAFSSFVLYITSWLVDIHRVIWAELTKKQGIWAHRMRQAHCYSIHLPHHTTFFSTDRRLRAERTLHYRWSTVRTACFEEDVLGCVTRSPLIKSCIVVNDTCVSRT
jgi:hypothetical protein